MSPFADLRVQLGDVVSLDAPLAPLCTYKVGGPAAALVVVESVEVLEELHERLNPDTPVLVIGKGSNLLISDSGFPGVAIQLGDAFSEVSVDVDQNRLLCGATALLPVAARRSAAAGLTGFEWAVGVPGSIGGAVRMNAGGHGADISRNLTRVSVFHLADGGPRERLARDLDLGYRTSNLESNELVLFAEFGLEKGDSAESEAQISEIVKWRRSHQPGGQNAGSVFANPPGDSAGRLIDAAGLKGLRIGTAEVSSKHANFIQADSGGAADDVYAVIREVQRLVRDRFGVDLHPENRLIGFTGGPQ